MNYRFLIRTFIVVAVIAILTSPANAVMDFEQPYDRTEPGTIALIHMDEFEASDWVPVGTPSAPNDYLFDIWSDNELASSDPVPHPGFDKYLDIANPDDRFDGFNRTRSDVMGETMQGPLTVEAWVKVRSQPGTTEDPGRNILIQQSGDGAPWSVTYEQDTTGGHIRFGHEQTDGFRYVHGMADSFSLDEWHHVRATRTWADAGGGMADYEVDIYLDGVLNGSEAWTGADFVDDSTIQNFRLYAGGNGGAAIPVLDGSIDEIRVSSRIIPEPATIAMLMLGGGILLRKRR